MSLTTPTDLAVTGAQAPDSTAAAARRSADAARDQVRRLAQEFESVLLTQMLRDMRRSMVDSDEPDQGFGAMTDTVDTEFGRALSKAGGFGLSNALLGALERLARPGDEGALAGEGRGGVSAGTAEPVLQPTALPAAPADGSIAQPVAPGQQAPVSVLATPAGAITSAFGARRDPINGAPGFHKGVDIAMAYGQNVPAAAAGTVVFAGEKGGYGNMVVVRHADGYETRYAHLSEPYVRAGDVVEAGGVLGKSGSSGWSTGPHLHFEVLRDGRALDPLDAKARGPAGGRLVASR